MSARVVNNSISLIDNILTNIDKYAIQSGNIVPGVSDHLLQFVLFKTDNKNSKNKEIFYKYYCSMNETTFVDEFNNLNSNHKLEPPP